MANLLYDIMNGNVSVKLYDDGTSIREWPDEEKPRPDTVCSVDCKITNYCDAGCPFCHEMSTKKGVHADIEVLKRILSDVRPGTEIAIGGGNPLDYPNLDELLRFIKDKQGVANLTINNKHFSQESVACLHQWQTNGLLYGIGRSVEYISPDNNYLDQEIFKHHHLQNMVYHAIVGVFDVNNLIRRKQEIPVLILGYKNYGFGAKHDEDKIKNAMRQWRYWLPRIIKQVRVVSFDNLALKQLRVRELLSEELWSRHYMGDDGQFTMYVDGVRDEYAISSTSPRSPMEGMTLNQAFSRVRYSEP